MVSREALTGAGRTMTGPEGLTGRDGAGGYPHPMSDAAEGRAPTAGPSAAEESTEPDQAWRIGAIAGVPVYLAKSWLVIAALVIYMFAPQVRTVRPADPAISAYLVAAAYAVVLLITVLIHEVAHAVVAVRARYQVRHIVVHLLGGHTIYDSTNNRPGASALVAVSGPAANFALAGICHLAAPAVPWEIGELLLNAATLANVFVGGFNLLPGLPLDGGHLVESLVWGATKNRNTGRIVAGWFGRVVTLVVLYWFLIRPALAGEPLGLFSIVWVGMIALFLWRGAGAAIRGGQVRGRLESVQLSTLLRPIRLARHTDSIAAIAPWLGEATVVVIGADQHPLGIVDPAALAEIPRSDWESASADAVAVRLPDPWVVQADPAGDVVPVAIALERSGAAAVVVIGPDGEPAGCVYARDVVALTQGTRA
jgi:Zn-dependent protease